MSREDKVAIFVAVQSLLFYCVVTSYTSMGHTCIHQEQTWHRDFLISIKSWLIANSLGERPDGSQQAALSHCVDRVNLLTLIDPLFLNSSG